MKTPSAHFIAAFAAGLVHPPLGELLVALALSGVLLLLLVWHVATAFVYW